MKRFAVSLMMFCVFATIIWAQKAPQNGSLPGNPGMDDKRPVLQPMMFEEKGMPGKEVEAIMKIYKTAQDKEMDIQSKLEKAWKELDLMFMDKKPDLKAIKKKILANKALEGELEYERRTIELQMRMKVTKESMPIFDEIMHNFNERMKQWEMNKKPNPMM